LISYEATTGISRVPAVALLLMRRNLGRVALLCAQSLISTGAQTMTRAQAVRTNGAKYLRGKGPAQLVYVREYRYYKNACHAERDLKKLTRKQKEELVRTFREGTNV
jgi:predicted GIY-YIG superfamily endonuclease